jgi:hypothetical protein
MAHDGQGLPDPGAVWEPVEVVTRADLAAHLKGRTGQIQRMRATMRARLEAEASGRHRSPTAFSFMAAAKAFGDYTKTVRGQGRPDR